MPSAALRGSDAANRGAADKQENRISVQLKNPRRWLPVFVTPSYYRPYHAYLPARGAVLFSDTRSEMA